jgi:hypothetical protein
MTAGPRTGLAAIGWTVSFTMLWLAQRAAHVSLLDVMIYRAVGQTVRDGGDIYALRLTSAHLPMTYPPFAGLLFVPLTWVGVDTMRTAVTAGNLLLATALAALSLRLVLQRRPSTAAVLLTAAWAVWSEPVWATLRYGQVNLLLAVLVLWDFTRRPDNRWTGVRIGIAAGIKITPLLFVVLLGAAALATGGRASPYVRRLVVACGAFAGTVVVGAVLLPHSSARYWSCYVFDPDRPGSAVDLANQSLRGVAARAGHTIDPGGLWLAAAVLVAAGGITVATAALAAADRLPFAQAWAVVTCAVTALLVSPVTWTHHWVWNVPMTVLLTCEAIRRRDRRWALAAAASVVVFCSYALWVLPHNPSRPELDENPAQMLLAAVYPLAGLAFLATAATVTCQALRMSRSLASSACAASTGAPEALRQRAGQGRSR